MIKNYGVVLLLVLLVGCGKQAVVINTPLGAVQGYVDNSAHTFLGIPYAGPPVDGLRWRPPQAIPAWSGTLEATELAAACPQFAPTLNVLMGEEDCLYLNVWTPDNKPEQAMPVMVWIHGGGFTSGRAAYTREDGQRLAAQTATVVVSMNYRLGVFGFLAHEALSLEDPSHPTSGNYGIEDQTAALRWVRDNIAAFGGDPDNVTIFGQSAGGVSVCAQLASPASAGLFHRAIIQSGPCDTPMSSLDGVSALGSKLSESLACDSVEDELECLRGKSTGQVADMLPPDPSFAFGEGYTVWWPVVDGLVLPMQFQQAYESGQFNQVPVINGTTLDEGSLIVWLSHNLLFKHLQAEQYLDRLEYLVGSRQRAELVAAQYPLENYGSPFEALTEAFSDGFFNCMARRTSAALAKHVPLWAYQFNYQDAPFFVPGAELKAFHSAEVQFIFGNPMSVIQSEFKGEQLELAQAMMDYWSQFAASGNPNQRGRAQWPRFDSGDQTLLFDQQIAVARDVHRAECRFWDRLDYKRAPYP